MRKDVLLKFEYFPFIGSLCNEKAFRRRPFNFNSSAVSLAAPLSKYYRIKRSVTSVGLGWDTRIFAFQYDYTCTLRFEWGPGAANISRAFLSSLPRIKPRTKGERYSISIGRCLPSDRLDFAVPPPPPPGTYPQARAKLSPSLLSALRYAFPELGRQIGCCTCTRPMRSSYILY